MNTNMLTKKEEKEEGRYISYFPIWKLRLQNKIKQS